MNMPLLGNIRDHGKKVARKVRCTVDKKRTKEEAFIEHRQKILAALENHSNIDAVKPKQRPSGKVEREALTKTEKKERKERLEKLSRLVR